MENLFDYNEKAKQYSRKEIKFKSLAIELEKEVKKIDRESLEQAKAFELEKKEMLRKHSGESKILRKTLAKEIKHEYEETMIKPLLAKFDLEKQDLIENHRTVVSKLEADRETRQVNLAHQFEKEKGNLQREFRKQIEAEKLENIPSQKKLESVRTSFEKKILAEKEEHEQAIAKERSIHRDVLNTLRETIEVSSKEHKQELLLQKQSFENQVNNLKSHCEKLKKEMDDKDNKKIPSLEREIIILKKSISDLKLENEQSVTSSEDKLIAIRTSIEADFTARLAQKNKEIQALHEAEKEIASRAAEETKKMMNQKFKLTCDEYENRIVLLEKTKHEETHRARKLSNRNVRFKTVAADKELTEK